MSSPENTDLLNFFSDISEYTSRAAKNNPEAVRRTGLVLNDSPIAVLNFSLRRILEEHIDFRFKHDDYNFTPESRIIPVLAKLEIRNRGFTLSVQNSMDEIYSIYYILHAFGHLGYSQKNRRFNEYRNAIGYPLNLLNEEIQAERSADNFLLCLIRRADLDIPPTTKSVLESVRNITLAKLLEKERLQKDRQLAS